MALFGYARVSSDGQSLDSQLHELTVHGCKFIYREKISGGRLDRTQLKVLLSLISCDDTLVVTRLDRLARSTRDLLNIIAEVTSKGAAFRSLKDAWADTTTAHGRLMLTVLGGLAEFERELIRSRTGDGRLRARERGVRFGRKPKLTTYQKDEALRRRDAGEPVCDIARSLNVSHSTISRLR